MGGVTAKSLYFVAAQPRASGRIGGLSVGNTGSDDLKTSTTRVGGGMWVRGGMDGPSGVNMAGINLVPREHGAWIVLGFMGDVLLGTVSVVPLLQRFKLQALWLFNKTLALDRNCKQRAPGFFLGF